MHKMNFYDPNLKKTKIYALPPVNYEQKNQDGPGFVAAPYGAPISTQNTTPVPAPTSEPYHIPLPNTNYGQFDRWRAREQQACPVARNTSDAMPNDLYRCNCLADLEGCYQINVPHGDKLQVVLAAQGHYQYAFVRQLGSASNQWMIYDEDSRFTLCSLNDSVEAVMLKGVGFRDKLAWYAIDGTLTIWRRVGDKSLAINNQASWPISMEFPRSLVSDNGTVVPTEGIPHLLISTPELGKTFLLTNCSTSFRRSVPKIMWYCKSC